MLQWINKFTSTCQKWIQNAPYFPKTWKVIYLRPVYSRALISAEEKYLEESSSLIYFERGGGGAAVYRLSETFFGTTLSKFLDNYI